MRPAVTTTVVTTTVVTTTVVTTTELDASCNRTLHE